MDEQNNFLKKQVTAFIIGGIVFLIVYMFFSMKKKIQRERDIESMKVLISNHTKKNESLMKEISQTKDSIRTLILLDSLNNLKIVENEKQVIYLNKKIIKNEIDLKNYSSLRSVSIDSIAKLNSQYIKERLSSNNKR